MRESIVLGGGCSWCLDAIFRRVKGVSSVVAGYSGGSTADPTYEQLHNGGTGHAEVVRVTYDPAVIDLAKILEIFWYMHDPTTLNRQGNDVGEQYRSIILYKPDQLPFIEDSITNIARKLWDEPLTTEIKPLEVFYPAEDYHQDYYAKNPQQGYCQFVINPKVRKFSEHFKDILK